MKKFETPEVEVLNFNGADVLTTSGNCNPYCPEVNTENWTPIT